MLEELFIKIVLLSLEELFIFIRSNPEKKEYFEIIKIYEKYLNKNMKFNYKIIKEINKEIKSIGKDKVKELRISVFKYLISCKRLKNKELVYKSLEILNYILNEMIKRMEKEEYSKVRTLASSVHNFPDFLFGNKKIESKIFYNEELLFYNREWKEDFMLCYKNTFENEFNKYD